MTLKSWIHSTDILLSAYCVPGSIMGMGDIKNGSNMESLTSSNLP